MVYHVWYFKRYVYVANTGITCCIQGLHPHGTHYTYTSVLNTCTQYAYGLKNYCVYYTSIVLICCVVM